MTENKRAVTPADECPVHRPVAALSANALRFLARLRDEGWLGCMDNPPSAGIQGLVDRGYCRLCPALVGPLGLRTGDVMVGLTEAGREALRHNAEVSRRSSAAPAGCAAAPEMNGDGNE